MPRLYEKLYTGDAGEGARTSRFLRDVMHTAFLRAEKAGRFYRPAASEIEVPT